MNIQSYALGSSPTYVRDRLYAVTSTNDILHDLEQRYISDPPTTLEHTVALCQSVLLPDNESLCIAIVTNATIHIAQQGGAGAGILRNDQWTPLLKQTDRISGPFRTNDRILLYTPLLESALDTTQIHNLISHSPETITDQFLECVDVDSYPSAGGILLVQTETVDKVVPPQRPSLQKKESHSSKAKKLRRATTAGIGATLGVLLIISMVLGSRARSKQAREDQLAQVLGTVSERISEGESLVDVNPNEAHEMLLPAQAALADALDDFPENSPEYQELVDLIEKTSQLIAESSRSFSLESPTVYLDLTWIDDSAKGTRIHRDLNHIVIVDTDNGSFYTSELGSKNNDVEMSDASLANAIDVARANGTSYALTSRDDNRIVSTDQTSVPENKLINDPVAMTGYAGNLYILDRQSAIVKLPQSEDGFSDPISYLGEDNTLNLSSAVDIAIDGSIWVATREDILKFTGGVSDAYFIKNEQLSDAVALYTDAESSYIYVLEKHRVVVFDKKGEYQEQYTSVAFGDATDILALNDTSILVLTPDTIYELERPSQ